MMTKPLDSLSGFLYIGKVLIIRLSLSQTIKNERTEF